MLPAGFLARGADEKQAFPENSSDLFSSIAAYSGGDRSRISRDSLLPEKDNGTDRQAHQKTKALPCQEENEILIKAYGIGLW